MKTIVISLGGSLINPDKIDYDFIKKFKGLISTFSKKYKFVIVTGGGNTARIYINALKKEDINEKLQCLIGIRVTRLNAWFMTNFFNGIASKTIAKDLKEVQNLIKKNNIIFCGSLRYEDKNTSDGTAAKIAKYLKAEFINITNVDGLYDKDPRKFRNAKFIPEISLNDFYNITKKIKYHAGQHFVLDQNAAEIIKANKIKTIILNGNKLDNLRNYLEEKRFIGTIIN